MSGDAPRRRVVLDLKMEADSWADLQSGLEGLVHSLNRHGELSAACVSGGSSSGHYFTTNEDKSITHESWRVALDAHLERLAK